MVGNGGLRESWWQRKHCFLDVLQSSELSGSLNMFVTPGENKLGEKFGKLIS